MRELKLIIFDVDGTMADTERYGHLPACNEAIKTLDLDFQWSWKQFSKLIKIPGTANRLRFELKNQNYDEEKITEIVKQFEPLKKNLYMEKYLPGVYLRNGIRNLIEEAVRDGINLAIVSTSYEEQIHSLLKTKLPDFQNSFKAILGKQSGLKTENNGFLHKKCLQITNCEANETLMIEDSQEGLEAALCAGISTAVFFNDYTYGSSFKNARLVAPDLGHFNLAMLKAICMV